MDVRMDGWKDGCEDVGVFKLILSSRLVGTPSGRDTPHCRFLHSFRLDGNHLVYKRVRYKACKGSKSPCVVPKSSISVLLGPCESHCADAMYHACSHDTLISSKALGSTQARLSSRSHPPPTNKARNMQDRVLSLSPLS